MTVGFKSPPVNLLTRLAGALALLIGLAHFGFLDFAYKSQDLMAVPELQREHFVYLGTYAIGSFLIAFGVLTLAVRVEATSAFIRLFLALTTAVWFIRLVLEVMYPVKLPMAVLDDPHQVLLPAVGVIWLLYLAGTAGHFKAAFRGAK